MTALQNLAADFSHKVRSLGKDYYRRGTVKLTNVSDDRLNARVQGTSFYQVEIEWDDMEVRYSCSCPFFQDRDEPCKHIWATLLAADAKGALPELEDMDEDQDDWDAPFVFPVGKIPGFGRSGPTHARNQPARHAIWRRRLTELRSAVSWQRQAPPAIWPPERKIFYVIDAQATRQGHNEGLYVELCSHQPKRPGAPEKFKRLRLNYDQLPILPDPADRLLISMLAGVGQRRGYGFYAGAEVPHQLCLRPGDNEPVRLMCQTGRCRLRTGGNQSFPTPIQWDDGEPWRLHLQIVPHEPGKTYRLEASLRRGTQQMKISKPNLIVPGGPVFIDDKAAALEDYGALGFANLLRGEEQIVVPIEQGNDLIAELLNFPRLPRLELPQEMEVAEVRLPPTPHLTLSPPGKPNRAYGVERLNGQLSFAYGERIVSRQEATPALFEAENRRIIYRDLPAEELAAARLADLGFVENYDYQLQQNTFRLLPRLLPGVVRVLMAEQWQVRVDGKAYRQPGKIRMEVSSGIDWFELQGEAEFDGQIVALPALLRAVGRGDTAVVLDDGTVGILPEEWLKRYGLLAAVADLKDETIQFTRNQVGLLDALLAEMPQVNVDETFSRARDELKRFDGIAPCDAPPNFVGVLRPYQREGLGWLNFLRAFGLNGCLADDMGLGKTIQVLALLEQRRLDRAAGAQPEQPKVSGPSLVVLPRSLVFNWHNEAAKFTPNLRVLDHTSTSRLKTTDHFQDYDVVLTTYGTVRNDIANLRNMRFDYVILDEAQAIKNSASESAKAARLLKADHRLALSGTPVQNHLGELWSLLEFLNPGMLGASRAFGAVANSNTDRSLAPETRQLLAAALRPFILRRTKEQVARDLPEKFEQTIFCDLDRNQRALYDELKEHYRQSLLGRIAQEGLAKSKFQILEALLRLRQAACHPGLISKTRLEENSAKLDTLLPRLAEVAEEGHKAIVFSQFTSFLAIVRKRLDEKGAVYEYLDGKTRDRQQKVDRFQTDKGCPLFLVSLKAGGLGLNLTAAQYVFLLDPWWNPAIEAQAIDRAHRIGQTKQVFAYRLIAKDTVEEKVLQLQQSKRELADAIINADNAVLSKLGKEELELLLS